MSLTRRQVLQLGTAAGAAALLPSCPGPGPVPFDEGSCEPEPADGAVPLADDPAALPQDDALFPTASVAGSVTASGARLHAFLDGAARARLRVWREAGGARLLARDLEVAAAEGHVGADVAGLAPNQPYSFCFLAEDGLRRSPVGRFRTAYPDGCRRALTVATTSCTHFRNAPYESLRVAAREPIDLMLHLGDLSYNDGATTLAEYRAKWRSTLADPGYRDLFARTSLLACWDDHEFANDSELYSADFPEERKEAAKKAFFEAIPMVPGPGGRLWGSWRWGATAEFFVLDSRLERRPETRQGPDATYLGRAQLDWLKAGLAASTAHFKVVLNSVPITNFPSAGLWDVAASDRWEGYAAQREELLAHAAGLRNVWFLSGDLHVGCIARVEPQGPASGLWEILGGPGANSNPLWALYKFGTDADREAIAPAAQFRFFGGTFMATTLVFDPESDSVRVRFIDAATREVVCDETLRQG